MGKWKMARLKDILEDTITGEWGTECLQEETGVKVLRTTNFTNTGNIDYSNVVLRNISSQKITAKKLKLTDIILEKSGGSDNQPVGRVVFFENKDDTYLCNNFTQILRVNINIAFPKYVFFYLFNLHKNGTTELLQNKTTGIRNLQTKRYLEQKVPLPPLDVQKKIAEVLDKASALIELRKDQMDKLDLLIKSQFIEMFGTENDLDRWNVTTVENVADVTVGVVIKPAQYYTDQSNGIKAFRSLNIGEMYVRNDSWVYFKPEGHSANLKSELKTGDVLVVRSGHPGTSCVVTDEYAGCNAIDIIIARPHRNVIHPIYLCAFTNFPHGKIQIRERTGGAAQQHFNVGAYKNMTISIPPIELQNEFSSFVIKLKAQKKLLQQSLDKLELNYKSLMQKCFRGDLFE